MMKQTMHKGTLQNGIRVMTIPMPRVETVTVYFFVCTGSHHEEKEMSGISHYLEHLFFKGSEKYKTPIEISSTLDGVGAAFNAFTSEEWTAFYVKLLKDKIEVALDVMGDFLKHPLFTDSEIEREKAVILEELNMYYDTPSRRVMDVLQEALYGDQPAGRDIGGIPETVKNITRENVVDYFQKQYRGENIIAVFAGNITHEASMELANQYFGGVSDGTAAIVKDPVQPPATHSPIVRIQEKTTDQTHIALGFPSYAMGDSRRYALRVLLTVLGGGMSSRLFHQVREQRGLCYAIGAGAEMGSDYGFSYIRSGIAKGKTEEAIEVIVRVMQDMKDEGITEQELANAKNNIEGHLYLGLEHTDGVAEFWGMQEVIVGTTQSPGEYIDALKSVSLQDTQEVANDVFLKGKTHIALVAAQHSDESLLGSLSQLE
ncbi:MAG: insulinase family protein [Candidatus Spechtbacteria bacterium SB0662_bin_43]|uniref:Insulinase family protein n=1 Tax=Candidatus Spechtbacteria bacterium SB0662_bin_43 TaxID=2604897 RepID=A0A845DD37_9BACT|nr:insulinase family protein [Candidatus Spechtbacteria bacterium SB0662_bin_43]